MRFFKNRICKVCGVEFEPTSTGQKYCIECGIVERKKQRAEICQKWQKENKKKISEYNKKAYLKRKENTKELK
ncbi:hypothetical protein EOM09_01915 [bacterium]|nr:hypothetical protein [bacterium]